MIGVVQSPRASSSGSAGPVGAGRTPPRSSVSAPADENRRETDDEQDGGLQRIGGHAQPAQRRAETCGRDRPDPRAPWSSSPDWRGNQRDHTQREITGAARRSPVTACRRMMRTKGRTTRRPRAGAGKPARGIKRQRRRAPAKVRAASEEGQSKRGESAELQARRQRWAPGLNRGNRRYHREISQAGHLPRRSRAAASREGLRRRSGRRRARRARRSLRCRRIVQMWRICLARQVKGASWRRVGMSRPA